MEGVEGVEGVERVGEWREWREWREWGIEKDKIRDTEVLETETSAEPWSETWGNESSLYSQSIVIEAAVF